MQDQIVEALRGGDQPAALALAREYVARSPGEARAQRLLALALRSGGDIHGAREALERAIAIAPDNARLHLEHAGLLLGANQLAEAGAVLQTVVGLDPNQFPAYVMQAQLAMGRNELDEAERLARLAARIAPEHPALQALRGTLALRRGDSEEALKLLSQAAQRAPDEPLILHALGFAYMAQGHLAFAEQAFRSLLALTPAAGMTRLLIAQLQVRQGRPAEAADELAPLLSDPELATPALQRLAGELELAAGRPARALAPLREAFAAMPGDPRTLAALVETWRRLGEMDDARRTLDAALAATAATATPAAKEELWRARLAVEPLGPEADGLIARWRDAVPESVGALEAEMGMLAAQGRRPEVEAKARELLQRVPGHAHAEMRLVEDLLERDPAAAAEKIQGLLAGAAPPGARKPLLSWLGLAHHRAGAHGAALEDWNRRNAEDAAGRVPLPAHTAAPASWPEPAAAVPGRPPAVFLHGLPGSLVERAAQVLGGVLPAFRDDRLGAQPPADAFQAPGRWAELASGAIAPAAVIGSWRERLPARRIEGAVIDWLPWWDHSYAAAMRAALPEAVLLLVLRDPRDMLLDWLAFGSQARFALPSAEAGAGWLAAGLDQLATLHEQDLLPHSLVRVDDIADDPASMAQRLGVALGADLPAPPPNLFGARRFAPGTWREYGELLSGPFATLAPAAARFGYPDA